MNNGEQWRPVASCPGYEVSDLGRVRSIDRVVVDSRGRSRPLKGRILVASVDKQTGYKAVALHWGRLGSQRRAAVHRLVALAFVEGAADGLFVCHNDGTRTNNVATNLRWDTPSENNRDQLRHGTHPWAFKTHCAQGHEFSDDNTKHVSGQRVCVICRRAAGRKYAAKRRNQLKQEAYQ